MFASLINQGGDRSVLNIIKATTDQWKSIIGEVKNCGRKVKLWVVSVPLSRKAAKRRKRCCPDF